MNLDELIMKGARAIGMDGRFCAGPIDERNNTIPVTIDRESDRPYTVQVDLTYLMEDDLSRLQIILRDMAEHTKELAQVSQGWFHFT